MMIGEHSIFSFDVYKHQFIEYFHKLFNTNDLNYIHESCGEYIKFKNGEIKDISDYETSLHKTFYKSIHTSSEFKRLYCNFIKYIHTLFFDNEEYLIYQSYPSVRFQFPGAVAVPPHFDSDDIGRHPNGEKNFLIPITSMHETQRLFIESAPGRGDSIGIDMDYGEFLYFNGNKCMHHNESNKEKSIRISLDFRVIKVSDYQKYILNNNTTTTNPRDPDKKRVPTKMIIGCYYQATNKHDSIERMMNWYNQKGSIMQTRPHFDENEARACYEYMMEDNFVTEFKKTAELEKQLAQFIGSKYCAMTTSGTSAIILALLSLDIKAGDEVIVPNYTMIATVNAVRMVGATPIITDVSRETKTISLKIIKKYITPATKAIIHVSLNNRHENIFEIAKFCRMRGIYLIEDAAQSLGCFIEPNKHFGTVGDIGCFSLSTPKIISTGQGGFVVTNSRALFDKISLIKNFGRLESGNDNFVSFGLNMKFTDIQAVIGLEQMKKLPARIKRLREIYDIYYENLGRDYGMIASANDQWIPWFVDIFVNNREQIIEFLKKHNIQTRAAYPKITSTPMYESSKQFPVADDISARGLFMPTHFLLTNDDILYICSIIKICNI